MTHLAWTFDWPVNRAVAVTLQGTYVIHGKAPADWSVKFTRAIPKSAISDSDSDSLNKTDLTFYTVADAMHACQKHADSCSWDSSGRWLQITPFTNKPVIPTPNL